MARLRKHHKLSLGIILAGCAVGVWMGGRTTVARADGAEDYLRTFTQILELAESRHVDEVASEELIEGAIRGMLQTLDPHSNFLEPRSYQEMREEQRGSFSGLGIVISLRGDENLLTVISPIEGTPAFRAGIRAGDVIAEIEGDETLGMSIDDALILLRGPRGTQVSIGIGREGYDEVIPFTLTRDVIPTNSIQYSYMIRPGVGYIRIKNFTQTTERELKDELEILLADGMEKLVLDLRWNPGGLLGQAIRVSSQFLNEGDNIVLTRGRTNRANEEYGVTEDGFHLDVPMIVLLNRGSASASEIVAGAIQDHDRGLVVGETSWGKGLVQTVYSLSNDSALALTTARYYTPSGRLIQRDYGSLEDYFSPMTAESDEDLAQEGPVDPFAAVPEEGDGVEETFYTDGGRKVYGGGGIRPDYRVPSDKLTKFAELLERRSAFFEFATHYRAGHDDEEPSQDTFSVDDGLLAEFKKFVAEVKQLESTDEDWVENLEYVKRGIRAEVLANYHGLEARNRVLSEGDRQLQEALKLFPTAARLLEMQSAAVDSPRDEELPQ
jgi:carboxyl-terminal processing protease